MPTLQWVAEGQARVTYLTQKSSLMSMRCWRMERKKYSDWVPAVVLRSIRNVSSKSVGGVKETYIYVCVFN